MSTTAKPSVKAFFHEDTNTATYVVWDVGSLNGLVIDAVLDFEPASAATSTKHNDKVLAFVQEQNIKVLAVLDTHAHADHLTGGPHLARSLGGGAKYGIGKHITTVQKVFRGVFNFTDMPVDGRQFDLLLDEGDEIKLSDELRLVAMHTPGHTPACMTYVVGDAVFTGDTIFMPDFGTARCDFPGGSATDLWHSIQRILALPDDTRVFVGHDYAPGGRAFAWETTVREEKASNKHVKTGTTIDEFISFREARDAQLSAPKLIFPSLQHNVRLGFGPVDSNGFAYLRTPVNFPLKPTPAPASLVNSGVAAAVAVEVAKASMPSGKGWTKVNDELFIAPQVSDEQLRELVHTHGVKSVINLRHHTEDGFMHEEEQLLRSLGVKYYYEPLTMATMTHERLDKVLAEMDSAPRPMLVHCASMMRAAAASLLHHASRKGLHPSSVMDAAHSMGFDCSARPEMQQLVMAYLAEKMERAANLPELVQITTDMYAGPQVTEQQLRDAAAKGVRSVLNLRSPDEAGSLGMGVLKREPDLVRSLGMQYVNIPTSPDDPLTGEQLRLIETTLESMPKPVLVHCRTSERAHRVVAHLDGRLHGSK